MLASENRFPSFAAKFLNRAAWRMPPNSKNGTNANTNSVNFQL